jgi:hypothetical protein
VQDLQRQQHPQTLCRSTGRLSARRGANGHSVRPSHVHRVPWRQHRQQCQQWRWQHRTGFCHWRRCAWRPILVVAAAAGPAVIKPAPAKAVHLGCRSYDRKDAENLFGNPGVLDLHKLSRRRRCRGRCCCRSSSCLRGAAAAGTSSAHAHAHEDTIPEQAQAIHDLQTQLQVQQPLYKQLAKRPRPRRRIPNCVTGVPSGESTSRACLPHAISPQHLSWLKL